MSVASRIQAIEDHIENAYDILEVGGLDTTLLDKNIDNITSSIVDRLEYYLANGLDVVWTNWEKVIGEGESLTLDNTGEAMLKLDLKGNTSQTGTPTPDSPIPINVVSGDNTITISNSDNTQSQTYPIYLGVENIIESSTTKDTLAQYQDVLYIMGDLKPSTTYTISFNGTSGNQIYSNENLFNQETFYVASGRTTLTLTTKSTISTTNASQYNETYGWIIFKNFTGGVPSANVFNNLQMVVGNKEQHTSTTPIELCKISTYQDYFYKTDKWYLHKEIGEITYIGASGENWTYYNGIVYIDNSNIKNIGSGIVNTDFYTNYFKVENSKCYIVGQRLHIVLSSFGLSSITTASDFKTWLSTHNTEVRYILATPTDTEITDTTLINQLDNIENAFSYEGTTNIGQVNNDKPFILDTTALKDWRYW